MIYFPVCKTSSEHNQTIKNENFNAGLRWRIFYDLNVIWIKVNPNYHDRLNLDTDLNSSQT